MISDTQTDMLLGEPKSAICVQRFDDSLNSAIHTTYRSWLRSSSMREPRDPPLKVVSLSFRFPTLLLALRLTEQSLLKKHEVGADRTRTCANDHLTARRPTPKEIAYGSHGKKQVSETRLGLHR